MNNEINSPNTTIPHILDKRSKVRNRMIEIILWETIWGVIGLVIIGMMLGIMHPLIGLILGLSGGAIFYIISTLSNNRCPYCDMILPKDIEICPDCKRNSRWREVKK